MQQAYLLHFKKSKDQLGGTICWVYTFLIAVRSSPGNTKGHEPNSPQLPSLVSVAVALSWSLRPLPGHVASAVWQGVGMGSSPALSSRTAGSSLLVPGPGRWRIGTGTLVNPFYPPLFYAVRWLGPGWTRELFQIPTVISQSGYRNTPG